MPDATGGAEKGAGCICGGRHCRRCGLSLRAAIAGVFCDPPFAGSHDFPTRVIPPGSSDPSEGSNFNKEGARDG